MFERQAQSRRARSPPRYPFIKVLIFNKNAVFGLKKAFIQSNAKIALRVRVGRVLSVTRVIDTPNLSFLLPEKPYTAQC